MHYVQREQFTVRFKNAAELDSQVILWSSIKKGVYDHTKKLRSLHLEFWNNKGAPIWNEETPVIENMPENGSYMTVKEGVLPIDLLDEIPIFFETLIDAVTSGKVWFGMKALKTFPCLSFLVIAFFLTDDLRLLTRSCIVFFCFHLVYLSLDATDSALTVPLHFRYCI